MASAVPELPRLARDQAFEALYRLYVKDVYHYALALLHNPADAEDVTQTTFMNAYRAYKRGEEIRKPQNWLIKIAHNVARTRYARASRRVKEVPLEDHIEQLAVPEEERPNIEGVLRALGRLPFNQRAAIVMRELEGRTYAEIADTLGVSVPAVETLIFRARRSLRLRASALRVLSVVPVPSSLAQLFGGGGVVAGGGALGGTGFLAKAVVALVAGALATGFSGDRSAPAPAAPDSGASLFAPAQSGAVSSQSTPSRQVVQKAARHRVRTAKGGRPAAQIAAGTTGQAITQSGNTSTASGTSSSTASTPTAQVTTVATDLISAVTEVVSAPTASLPIQTPTLPSVPVPPPPPPPLPKLP